MSWKRNLWLPAAALLCAGLACVTAPAMQPAAAPTRAPAAEMAAAPEAAATEAPAAAEAPAAEAPAAARVVVTQVVEKQVEVEKVVGSEGTPQPTPADMTFQAYGVNPFVQTADDHLSTFALDVDTGSYTLMRAYVNEGHLPPQEAIRVEEFVNYFDQEYPQPAAGKAFTVTVDGGPFPFAETDQNMLLRVGIQGYEIPPEQRKPVVLTFVVDTSGSMNEGDRIGMVKRALASLVPQLRSDDSVIIVGYSEDAYLVLARTAGDDKGTILDAVYRLTPTNSTNAEAGLRLGYRQASEQFDPAKVNRVILLSDGVANVGSTGPESIWEGIKAYADQGITLMTVGVGMGNYNDVLLEQLADQGNGQYAYVDSADEARRIFEQNLTGALQPIALDAKVQVDFNAEVVQAYRLIGFENRAVKDEEFREASAKGGGIGAGHNVTALYEIDLRRDVAGNLATVFLRWTDPETQETIETERILATSDLVQTFGGEAPRLQWDAVVAEYAEILRGSPFAKESTLAAVLEEAERVAGKLAGDKDVAEFVELVRQAVKLQ